jgi:hypothetical protein
MIPHCSIFFAGVRSMDSEDGPYWLKPTVYQVICVIRQKILLDAILLITSKSKVKYKHLNVLFLK